MSTDIHYPSTIEIIDIASTYLQATGVVPVIAGAVVVGIGVGIVAWVGIAIWSKVQSWQIQRAGRAGE